MAGFERVIRHHFALQREAVLKQCAEWVKGCEDPDLLKRLRQAADAIFEELMGLEVDFDEKEEDSEEEDEIPRPPFGTDRDYISNSTRSPPE